MVFALKGAHRRMFLALELYPHLGMHTKLYQPLILSVLLPTLDCSAHKRQTVQLRRQPLWEIDLKAMLGRLQQQTQEVEANHFNLLIINHCWWSEEGLTLILPEDTTKTASRSTRSPTLAMKVALSSSVAPSKSAGLNINSRFPVLKTLVTHCSRYYKPQSFPACLLKQYLP